MASDKSTQRDWTLYERITRSLAHSVGNTINVVSGRLSLLESQSELGEDRIASVRRARARLLTLQDDLRGALRFSPEDAAGGEQPLVDLLSVMGSEGGVDLRNRDVLQSSGIGLAMGNECGLRRLAEACFLLHSGTCQWHLGSETTPARQSLTLTVQLDAQRVPADRRALLEPWFSREAQALDAASRHGRLLLAQALGVLEDVGAGLSLVQGSAESTSVVLTWSA